MAEAMSEGKWHSPDELPKDNETVLAWTEYTVGGQTACMYDLKWHHKGKWHGIGRVLAWAPIPEPPEDIPGAKEQGA